MASLHGLAGQAGTGRFLRQRMGSPLSALCMFMLLVLAGCATSPKILVTLSPSGAQSVMGGQTVNLTAAVTGDSKAAGVTWSLNGPGALSAQTSTSVTYTAPSPVSASATVTITATSASDTTKTASVTINLQAVTVSVSPNSAQTDEQGQITNVTATAANDPANKGVTWSLSGAGSLTGQTTTAVSYHAPASITAASTATLTATSVFDNTKTASLTINLVPPPAITTSILSAGTVGVSYSAALAATNGVSPYTWSVTAGALPGGLTLSGSTISGMPTAYGTFNFTVQVKDASNYTATANLSIKISPAPVQITTTGLSSGVVNAAYSVGLQSTGGAAPITWSITSGALPTGLALVSNGTISGIPTAAGTFNFTVQASDSSSPALTASKALSITVAAVLSVTTASVPNAIVGQAYSVTVQSSGGIAPVTWSVSSGGLPPGVTLNANTGALSGTPTTSGNYSFTLKATDSGTPTPQTATKNFSMAVYGVLSICFTAQCNTSSQLPNGAVSSNYSVNLFTNGGAPPITWSQVGGTLPPGLALTQSASTGIISGTPTTSGTYVFTIQAADAGTPQQTATKQYTLIINPALAITTASLPSGTVNTAYSTTVQSNGGGISPLVWSWAPQSGSTLPGGLNINSSTGAISGTPTAAGTFNVTVTAKDSGSPTQTASQNFSITIATAPLSITTASLPNAIANQPYSTTLQSAGGNPPVTWSIASGTALPSWATLNASTGAITGTPTTSGVSTSFTAKATDSSTPTAQTMTQPLSITVVAALSITTTSLPNGTTGASYSTTLAATGGTQPYTWSWTAQSGSSLPPGLNLASSGGAISGTPTTAGTYNVKITVTDSTNPTQSTSANLSVTIASAPLVINTTNLQNGVVSSSYNQTLSFTGGTPPVTWSITSGSLPAGLSLNTSSGAITGTPTTAGTSSFTVKATDSTTPTPQTATRNLSITVNSAGCGSGSEALLNGQYAFVLKGFDNASPAQPALIGGVLTFNGVNGNGLVTAGALDENLSSGFDQANSGNPLTVTSGSYTIGSDHRGCMTLTTSAGTSNYRFSLGNISSGVASTGHMVGFDTSGPFTAGVLRKQTPSAFSTSQVTGNYAFGVSSVQNTVKGGKFGAVGVFNFSSGSIAGGEVDFNETGKLDGNSALTAFPASAASIGSCATCGYTVSTNGRGTLTFLPGGAPSPVQTVIYVVSSTELLILSSDTQTTDDVFAGSALKQSGSFSNASLNGTVIIYQSDVGSSTGTSDVEMLSATFNGSGSVTSATQIKNDAGTVSGPSALPAGITYAVSSTGRVLISGGGTHPPLFRLAGANTAFFLGSGTGVESGMFEPQTSTAAPNATYAFGNVSFDSANGSFESGVATFTSSSSAVSGTSDENNSSGASPNNPFSGTFSVSAGGLGVIPSGCTIAGATNPCDTAFYIISPTRAVVMDVKPGTAGSPNSSPHLETADQ